MSTKERTATRMRKRWELSQKEKAKRDTEQEKAWRDVSETLRTDGWKILLKSLEFEVHNLTEELAEISVWRVFKGMELRSKRRAYKRLLAAMKGEEKRFLTLILNNS